MSLGTIQWTDWNIVFIYDLCEHFNAMLLYQLYASSQELERLVVQLLPKNLLKQCLTMIQG